MMQPDLRFSEFNDEWQTKKLKDVATIERGRFSPRPRNDPIYYGGDIPFVQTGDVVNSKGLISRYTQTLNQKGLAVSKLFPKGTILMTIAANIGHTGILAIDMAAPDSLVGIKPKDNNNNVFLNYYLSTQQGRMDRIASQAAQKNINIEFLKPYPVSWTTANEQQKIADFLTIVDEKVGAIDKKVEKLKQYKKGVMQKIFSQQIRFTDENGNTYADWTPKKLDYILSIKKGEQLNRDTFDNYGTYPVINGGTTASGYAGNYNTNQNTITISEGGNSCGYVNYIKTKFWSGGHCYVVEPKAHFDNQYTYYLLKRNEEEIKRLRVGSGLPNIQKSDMLKFAVNISVDSVEQTKISIFLTALDDEINLIEKELDQAKQFKKALLQRMFV